MLGDELRTIAKTRNAAETTSHKTSRKSKWLNIKVPTQDGRKKSEKKAQQIEKSRDHHANCLRNKSSLTAKNMHQQTHTTTEKRRNEETQTHKHAKTVQSCFHTRRTAKRKCGERKRRTCEKKESICGRRTA